MPYHRNFGRRYRYIFRAWLYLHRKDSGPEGELIRWLMADNCLWMQRPYPARDYLAHFRDWHPERTDLPEQFTMLYARYSAEQQEIMYGTERSQ